MEDFEEEGEEEDEEDEDFLPECASFCFFGPLSTNFLATSGEVTEGVFLFFLSDSAKKHNKHVKIKKLLTKTNIIHMYLMSRTRILRIVVFLLPCLSCRMCHAIHGTFERHMQLPHLQIQYLQ